MALPGQQPQVISGLAYDYRASNEMTQGGQLLPYITDHVYCNYGKNFLYRFPGIMDG
jgi:hypothetical protein